MHAKHLGISVYVSLKTGRPGTSCLTLIPRRSQGKKCTTRFLRRLEHTHMHVPFHVKNSQQIGGGALIRHGNLEHPKSARLKEMTIEFEGERCSPVHSKLKARIECRRELFDAPCLAFEYHPAHVYKMLHALLLPQEGKGGGGKSCMMGFVTCS